LKFFKEYYKNQSNHTEKELNQLVDLETKVRMQAEIEISNWSTLAPKINHSNFIKDKGLESLFLEFSVEMLRNRLLISSIQK